MRTSIISTLIYLSGHSFSVLSENLACSSPVDTGTDDCTEVLTTAEEDIRVQNNLSEGDQQASGMETRISGSGVATVPGDNTRVIDVAGDDLGVAQLLDPLHYRSILKKIEDARHYLNEDIESGQGSIVGVRKNCKNRHELCGHWSVLGGK